MRDPDSQWNEETWPEFERNDPFKVQARAFLDAIAGRSRMACSLEEAIHTLKCNLAVLSATQNLSGWQSIT